MDAIGETSFREAPESGWADSEPERQTRAADRPSRPLRGLSDLRCDRLISDLLFVVEICVISLLGVLAAFLMADMPLTLWTQLHPQIVPYMLVPAGTAALLQANGLYGFERLAGFSSSIARVIGSVCAAFGFSLLVDFALQSGQAFSGLWLAAWLAFTVIGLLVLRAGAGWLCHRLMQAGAVQQSVAIVGTPDAARSVMEALKDETRLIETAGVFAPSTQLVALLTGARDGVFDRVVIASDNVSSSRIAHMLSTLRHLPCAVQIALPLHRAVPGVTEPALALVDVQSKPISGRGLVVKRGLDICLATAGLLVLAPMLAVVALAIKLDSPGPILFAQRRHGLNRKEFKIFKLRTMSVMEDGAHAVQAARKDARVTRVGAVLRKTSIDELPQLFNVLRGDMSLVGPRPHPLSLDNQYASELETYSSRHKVKPGITGWAQINGHRGPTDKPGLMQSRVQHDLHYINNWSFWLDMKIIAATPFLGVIHKNAV